jgi:DNA-binding transcriptional regulator LsrR (DeoR family)
VTAARRAPFRLGHTRFMSHSDELRLMTKVARMYYDQGIRQQEITERLNIHQSTISRLLKKARATNIVRISVTIPAGIFSDLEEGLESRYHLKQAVVVDTTEEEERAARDLGAAAAFLVESSIKPGMIIGISSWSRALVAMVDCLRPSSIGRDGQVVQILGGIGHTVPHYHATQLAHDFATRIGASAVLLQAPGIVGSADARRILARDPAVQQASNLFSKVDIALVGIGAIEPSKLLASSGNVFSLLERKQLAAAGAVGDICMRYFDAHGRLIASPLMDRVIGMNLNLLKKAPRIVGIAGGSRKTAAIRAALEGGWINTLSTDRETAHKLLDQAVSTRSEQVRRSAL